MSDSKETTEQIKELSGKIDEKLEEFNESMAGKSEVEDLSEKQKELKGDISSLLEKYEEQNKKLKEAQEDLRDSQKEIDQIKTEAEKMDALGKGGKDYFSKAVQENAEALKGMVNKDRGRSASLQVKADFLEKATMTTGNALDDRRVIPYERVTQTPIFDPEERPLRDYINVSTISSDSAEWPIEQSASEAEDYDYNNQAGAVDSDAVEQKPESDFDWDLKTRVVRDIAHTARLHRNLMNDLPLLQSYLPNRLRDGLLREESRQILRGQDSEKELIGLNQDGSHVDYNASGFQAAIANTGKALADANFIDILGYAITQNRLNNYGSTLILMNPEDYFSLLFSVDSDGQYHMNHPLWMYVANLVVQSNYVTKGKFFVMDAARATTLFQRENLNIEFSYEDRDNFVKNLVTIRAEERAVLVTERPNAVNYGDFTEATATS